MLSILANFRQKVMIWQLIFKLVLLTSFGFFLPFQAFASNGLEINNVEIENTRDELTISWRTNLNATARVDYGLTTDYGHYISDTSADSKNHSFNIHNLEPDTIYHFQISSNANGQFVSSFDMVVETQDYNDGDRPGIKNFSKKYVTSQTATFQWEVDEKSTAKIYYGVTSDYGKVLTIKGSKKAFEATLTKLDLDTKYYYKIEIKDEDDNLYTRTGDFTTEADNELENKTLEISRVEPITNNDPAVSYTAATVSWRANKLADGFVRYGTSATKLNKKIDNNNLFKDFNQSAHISGLKSNTVYYFQVEVKDIFGKTVKSNIFSFKTKEMPANIKPASSVPTKVSQLRKFFTPASNLYKNTSNGNIYAIINNQKHLILNSNFFERYGYSLKNVKTASNNLLQKFSDVRLVKDPSSAKIYYLSKKSDGVWKKIDLPSPEVFSSYAQNQWSKVVTIDKTEIDNYANINLIKAQNDKTVYLLESGVKRPIANATIFESKGYKWSDILEISSSHLDAYVTGTKVY